MNDATLTALTQLAIKLGTTTEYLWGALLKQAPIDGTISLLKSVSLLLLILLWGYLVLCKTKSVKETSDLSSYVEVVWEDEVVALAWASVAALVFLAFFVCWSEFANSLTGFLNPDYWALQRLLEIL